jgi:1,2-diacylglycerol 3-beta-galactosyltransferase
MIPLQSDPQPHIVFLFSDTGGGHRSAASAIIEALELEYPGQVSTKMIDLFKDYAPPPLDMASAIYPPLSRAPDVWERGYKVSDSPRRMRILYDAIWPYVRLPLRRFLRENPCDLMVSVHPLFNEPVLRAIKRRHLPFVTVVTDLVSTHAAWFDHRANRIIVPTAEARRRGLEVGVEPEQMTVIGLPVAERFCCLPMGSKDETRKSLNWPEGKVILLVGGGEGMGPLEEVAEAINAAHPAATLVVVTGRNKNLRAKLEKKQWDIPVLIYGFVQEMPEFMRAADLLITKAGPGTISEAFIAGLPIILYSRLPGQEEGNVTYVVAHGAGVWAPQPEEVAAVVSHWMKHPALLEEISRASLKLARPTAAREIARCLVKELPIPIPNRTNP